MAATSTFRMVIIGTNARLAIAGSGPVNAFVRAIGVIFQVSPQLSLHQPSTRRTHRRVEDPLQGSVQEKKKVAGGRSAMADALRLASASRPSWTSCCSLETIISGKVGGISGTSIPVDPEISNFLHLCVGDPRPTCLSRTHTADLCLLSGGSIDRDAHQSRSGKDVARSADPEQSFEYLGRRVPIDVLL